MRESESKSESTTTTTILPESRAKIAMWLYDVADYLELDRECVSAAMGCVDRFMSGSSSGTDGGTDDDGSSDFFLAADGNRRGRRRRRQHHRDRDLLLRRARSDATAYQLLAISALFSSAKMSDKLASIDAEVLAMASHGSYTANEIVETERTLLEALGWRLCQPSAMEVARHVVALLAGAVVPVVVDNERSSSSNRRRSAPRHRDNRLSSVADFARLQIELSVSCYASSVLRLPSTVAIAAVSNSIELLDFSTRERRSFARILASLGSGGGVVVEADDNDVEGARRELRDAFDGRWMMGGGGDGVTNGAGMLSAASVVTSTLGHSVHSGSYSRRSPVAVDDNDEDDVDADVGFAAPPPPPRRTSAAAAARGSRSEGSRRSKSKRDGRGGDEARRRRSRSSHGRRHHSGRRGDKLEP